MKMQVNKQELDRLAARCSEARFACFQIEPCGQVALTLFNLHVVFAATL